VELVNAIRGTDGDVVIIGGLTENKESGSNVGFSFLPDWMRSSTASKSEILLVLQINKL
jgi:hypothetical protein